MKKKATNDRLNICLIPRVHGVGGMVSFQARLSAGLQKRGIRVTPGMDGKTCDAVLITGGTRDLAGLWQMRRAGVRIVQRLDGINWIHRRVHTGWRHRLKAEYGNFLLRLIRRSLVDHIIYQSDFARRWYEDWFGPSRVPWRVVHNAVDLQVYSPDGPGQRPKDRVRLLVVEGSLAGGYEIGLEWAVRLAEGVARHQDQPVELVVVGSISAAQQSAWNACSRVPITWAGTVAPEKIPEIMRSAHLFFPADIHPACPNSVIEALGCGLPVIAFDTGALAELVTAEAGRVVPYGADPWKLENPDIETLVDGAVMILEELPRYQAGGRRRAEQAFGLERMLDNYLEALTG